jgi:nucleoside-diphosphate-sugar epimerase
MPMKVAVTGPNGWIAQNLLSALKVDTFANVSIQRDWLKQINGTANTALLSALHGCDSVVHLAALVHQMSARPTLAEYRKVNCDLTLELAQTAAQAGVKQFVFVSTAKVMGEFSTRPFTESDTPAPTDDYAISKLEAEVGLRNLQRAGKLGEMKIVIVRPPLVYGEGAVANYAKLIALAKSRWPLPLGNATAPRSMVNVNHLTNGLIAIVKTQSRLPEFETFFATDAIDQSTAHIIRAARAAQGRGAGLITVPSFAMRVCLNAVGKQGIYDRLFTSLQVNGNRFNALVAELQNSSC